MPTPLDLLDSLAHRLDVGEAVVYPVERVRDPLKRLEQVVDPILHVVEPAHFFAFCALRSASCTFSFWARRTASWASACRTMGDSPSVASASMRRSR